MRFPRRTVVRTVMMPESDITCRHCGLRVLPGEWFKSHTTGGVFSVLRGEKPTVQYTHSDIFVCVARLRERTDAVSAAEAMLKEAQSRE